jgi:hypothetical protein
MKKRGNTAKRASSARSKLDTSRKKPSVSREDVFSVNSYERSLVDKGSHSQFSSDHFSSRSVSPASKEIDLLQREIDKQTSFLLHPLEFHSVTFVISLILLAIVFSSKGIILYLGLTGLFLAAGALLHHHGHITHHVARMLGLFIIPAVIALLFMPDTLLWILLCVFIISFGSAFIIHHWHDRVHKLSQLMLVSVYSRTVSLTAGILVMLLLSKFVFPDYFVSFAYFFGLMVLPAVFVYFYLSRFMYLYFFDHVHVAKDASRAVHQSVIFTAVFAVIVMIFYASFASVVYSSQISALKDSVDERVLDAAALQKSLERAPVGLRGLEVFRLFEDDVSLHMGELGALRASLDAPFTFDMVIDDSYYTVSADATLKLKGLSVRQLQLFDLKKELFSDFDALSDTLAKGGAFPDGTTSLDSFVSSQELKTSGFEPLSVPSDVDYWYGWLNDPSVSVSYVEEEGLGWMFSKQSGVDLYRDAGLFESSVFSALRNTLLYRDSVRLVLCPFVIDEFGVVTSPFVERIWNGRYGIESSQSKALRFGVISAEMDRVGSLVR